jgi:hypothetical protein
MEHRGGCHCGAVRIAYRSDLPAAEHTLRACQCGFCRRHASRAVSDPDGSAEIAIADEAKVSRYRFGMGTADYVVCRDCGVYVAAVIDRGRKVVVGDDRQRAGRRGRVHRPARAGRLRRRVAHRAAGAAPRPLDADYAGAPSLTGTGSRSK